MKVLTIQGDAYKFMAGSQVTLVAPTFQINGQEVGGLVSPGQTKNVNLHSGSVLSGTLADETPSAFSDQDFDQISDGTLILRRAELPQYDSGPILVASDSLFRGIRAGQHVTVENGGMLPKWFNAGRDSAVTLEGRSIDSFFEAVDARVDVLGGTVGTGFDAFHGTAVRIFGGTVGANFGALNGSMVDVSDGIFGQYFHADAGSRVVISGGYFDKLFSALGGSSVTIRGGDFGERFRVL